MDPQTFIFLGISGSGKGTQVRKICAHLEAVDPKRDIVGLAMGDRLREMWKQDDYTSKCSKDLMKEGKLQPSFIQIYTWTQFFIENLKGEEHLVIDGTPRRIEDSKAMDAALRFYDRNKPNFVFLNISREEAKKRLLERGSASGGERDLRSIEDEEERINSRLDWYEKFVVPAVNFFRDKPYYNFIEVDGERPIDDVHKQIIKQAF